MQSEERKSKIDALRLECLELLAEEVGAAPKISPETAAPFIGKSHTVIYAWLSDAPFAPRFEDLENINKFLKILVGVREGWKKIIIAHSIQNKIHPAIHAIFYNPVLIKILEDPKKSIDKKVELLTKKTLKFFAQKLEEN